MAAWIDVDLLQQYTHSVSQFSFVENGFHTYPKKKQNKMSNYLSKSKKAVQSNHKYHFFVYLASANLTLSRQAPYP